MNEATPPWRAFSSDASEAATPEPEASVKRRSLPSWLIPLLVGLAGLAVGTLAVGLVMLSVSSMPSRADALVLPVDAAAGGLELAAAPAATVEIVVDVAGAVVRPGLHRLHPGDRVGDAIEAAGGFAPRADLAASSQALNLAQQLEDGAKVLVPELGIDRASSTAAGADDGRIDLNRASGSELESLPGIGPVTAGKIMAAREEERFDAVRELRGRGLVGESVYEDIKGLVSAS